jgi:hypothetical protein
VKKLAMSRVQYAFLAKHHNFWVPYHDYLKVVWAFFLLQDENYVMAMQVVQGIG